MASWSVKHVSLQAHRQDDAMNLPFVLQFRRGVIFFIWADAKGSEKGERTERSPFPLAEMYLPGFSSNRRENPILICSDETSSLSQHWV